MSKPGSLGFDFGKPPDAVVAHQEHLQRIVSGAAQVTPPADPSALPPAAEESGDEEAAAPTPVPQTPSPKSRRTDTVTLTFVPEKPELPSFKVSFQVSEACVRETYISLLIASDFQISPSHLMKFDLVYRGQCYPVIFAGSEFEFSSQGIRGISFLVDRKRTNDQNRQS